MENENCLDDCMGVGFGYCVFEDDPDIGSDTTSTTTTPDIKCDEECVWKRDPCDGAVCEAYPNADCSVPCCDIVWTNGDEIVTEKCDDDDEPSTTDLDIFNSDTTEVLPTVSAAKSIYKCFVSSIIMVVCFFIFG